MLTKKYQLLILIKDYQLIIITTIINQSIFVSNNAIANFKIV